MKILLLSLALFFPCKSFSRTGKWFFDRAINGVEFWKNPEEKNCRIVVDAQEEASQKPLDYYSTDVFRKELQKRKRETLSFFGVQDWTVKIDRVNKVKTDIFVDFSGAYRDREDVRVAYRERHVYGPKRFVQLLYTCPEKILTTDVAPVFDLIQASPKGVR